MPENMDDLSIPAATHRKGSNPLISTQRGKMQSQRSVVNHQLFKQMRLRTGAENLYNATTNTKVKETVALELSFVNSNVQLLKEELNEINSKVEPYQSRSGKAVSIPMLPLGLKETNELEFTEEFEKFIASHYGESPSNFQEEIADFADLRTEIRAPARNQDGVQLLLDYYNQLHFIENRFFTPSTDLSVFFHWYDAISGVPATQRSICLEKASVLFNIGALYSQIGTREDRSRRSGIESAIDCFQKSAGIFEYLRNNFVNSPTPDLSRPFLTAFSRLMLAQAQECELELQMLGGFEIELGKCLSISRASMKVAEKYMDATKAFRFESLKTYIPYSWVNMVRVKSHHYQALSHYYAGLGLLKQHELAEPVEIAKLLSSMYDGVIDSDVPKPEDAAKRKEDRKKLGKSHLRHAVFCHEQALQTHSLCKIERQIDVLKEYLQHAHRRSLAKFAEIDSEEDFFDLVETPSIQGYADNQSEVIYPDFNKNSSQDIFHRLGPLSTFSARNHIGSPRSIELTEDEAKNGFTLQGGSPVSINDIDQRLQDTGLMNDDVIVSVDGVDTRWSDRDYVTELLKRPHDSPFTVKVISVTKVSNQQVRTSLSDELQNMKMSFFDHNSNRFDDINFSVDSDVSRLNKKNKDDEQPKKRHSFGFFNGFKLRALQNPFSTISENSASSNKRLNLKHSLAQRRSSTTSRLRSNSDFIRQNNAVSLERRSDC